MRAWILGVMAVLAAGTAMASAPQTVTFDVQNMTCPACSITIEKALGQLPGVSSAQVDAQASTVTVSFDEDRTSVQAVARTITNAGFPARARANRD